MGGIQYMLNICNLDEGWYILCLARGKRIEDGREVIFIIIHNLMLFVSMCDHTLNQKVR